ncbi:TetR/AcrR family transcriptional regulator [Paenibacillus chartarius]|uniref:TetR/AcrR family transcriptional regulator n=1 Tax=Paenibacillus chartarius TaxID=747481 RepID=A0ABV6DUD7_9BACL
MNGFERRKQKKTEQIFAAACSLLQKYGYSKVSVNEIAAAAHVSPATVFNYFGTKEQMFAEMLEDWMDKQLAKYEEILESSLAYPEKLKAVMLAEAGQLKFLLEDLRDVQHLLGNRSEEKLRQFFMKLIAKGRTEGYIPMEFADELVQRYLNMYLREFRQGVDPSQAEPMLRLFFYGLSNT